jgi:Na+/phosphate symporter
MVSSIFAVAIYYWRVPGILGIFALALFILYRNYRMHKTRSVSDAATEIFNLKKVSDPTYAINASFEHSGYFLKEVNQNLNQTFQGLFSQNRIILKNSKKETKKIQKWTNIIIANIFKTLRLLHKQDMVHTQAYAHTIDALQEIAESQRDAILRSYTHISNNHKGLLDVQIEELKKIQTCLNDLLNRTAGAFLEKKHVDFLYIRSRFDKIRDLVDEFDKNQIKRIQDESSKTRLSILFYGMMSDCTKVAQHTLNLLAIFQDSFQLNNTEPSD